MPPSALIARDQRILAGHAAGATILQLAVAEEVNTAAVRRVLVAAGIAPCIVGTRQSRSRLLGDEARRPLTRLSLVLQQPFMKP
jgi:hypothetical protein